MSTFFYEKIAKNDYISYICNLISPDIVVYIYIKPVNYTFYVPKPTHKQQKMIFKNWVQKQKKPTT